MANTTFDGPVRSRAGFQSIGPGSTVALTAATNLTVAAHAGRILTMDPVGTPTAITLPSIVGGADSTSQDQEEIQTTQAQSVQLLKFFSLMNSLELFQLMELTSS